MSANSFRNSYALTLTAKALMGDDLNNHWQY